MCVVGVTGFDECGECSRLLVRSNLSFFFQAEDGIRDLVRSRGLGDVYKRQVSLGGLVPVLHEAAHRAARQRRQAREGRAVDRRAVSYTHLTLPTIYSV